MVQERKIFVPANETSVAGTTHNKIATSAGGGGAGAATKTHASFVGNNTARDVGPRQQQHTTYYYYHHTYLEGDPRVLNKDRTAAEVSLDHCVPGALDDDGASLLAVRDGDDSAIVDAVCETHRVSRPGETHGRREIVGRSVGAAVGGNAQDGGVGGCHEEGDGQDGRDEEEGARRCSRSSSTSGRRRRHGDVARYSTRSSGSGGAVVARVVVLLVALVVVPSESWR